MISLATQCGGPAGRYCVKSDQSQIKFENRKCKKSISRSGGALSLLGSSRHSRRSSTPVDSRFTDENIEMFHFCWMERRRCGRRWKRVFAGHLQWTFARRSSSHDTAIFTVDCDHQGRIHSGRVFQGFGGPLSLHRSLTVEDNNFYYQKSKIFLFFRPSWVLDGGKEEFRSNLFSRRYVTVLKFQKTRKKISNTQTNTTTRLVSTSSLRLTSPNECAPHVSVNVCFYEWNERKSKANDREECGNDRRREKSTIFVTFALGIGILFRFFLLFNIIAFLVYTRKKTRGCLRYRLRSRHFNIPKLIGDCGHTFSTSQ